MQAEHKIPRDGSVTSSTNQKKVCTQWKMTNDLLPTPSMTLALKLITVKQKLCI